MMEIVDQIVDTWDIHNRINLYLLDAIPLEALSGTSASKGRSVAAEFAHMHNVRLMWLKSAALDLHDSQVKIDAKAQPDKPTLADALNSSGQAIASLLKIGLETGKIKGFKPHPVAFLGYLISHESYHRGEIGIILTQSGHPLEDKISYGLWEWGTR